MYPSDYNESGMMRTCLAFWLQGEKLNVLGSWVYEICLNISHLDWSCHVRTLENLCVISWEFVSCSCRIKLSHYYISSLILSLIYVPSSWVLIEFLVIIHHPPSSSHTYIYISFHLFASLSLSVHTHTHLWYVSTI